MSYPQPARSRADQLERRDLPDRRDDAVGFLDAQLCQPAQRLDRGVDLLPVLPEVEGNIDHLVVELSDVEGELAAQLVHEGPHGAAHRSR